jgi:hypothetical protein
MTLAALMVLTSIALASLVTAWLVPPYLALVAWILFPLGKERSNAHQPAAAITTPHQVQEASSDVVTAQAGATAASEPPMEPSTEAESLVEEAESTEPVSLKSKRGRARSRKGKSSVEPPANATWVQVGPGKFVRVESASPMVAHFSQAPEAKPAEDTAPTDPPVIEQSPVAQPLDPPSEITQVIDEGPSITDDLEPCIEASAVDVPLPTPTCEEALPPSGPELVDDAQPVETEVSGYHLDEPHEVNSVPENVEEYAPDEDEAVELAQRERSMVDLAADDTTCIGDESEKLGIAPEASDPEPNADPEAEPFDDSVEAARLDTEPDACTDFPAESSTDRRFPAFFREPWFPRFSASWSEAHGSSTRRNLRSVQSGTIAPGFRQRLRRSAGRSRQHCRTFPPRAPPQDSYWTRGRPSSSEKGRPSLPFISSSRSSLFRLPSSLRRSSIFHFYSRSV